MFLILYSFILLPFIYIFQFIFFSHLNTHHHSLYFIRHHIYGKPSFAISPGNTTRQLTSIATRRVDSTSKLSKHGETTYAKSFFVVSDSMLALQAGIIVVDSLLLSNWTIHIPF